jgi:hypothetical protein
MDRLVYVMGTLLETWNKRYNFEHDRKVPKLTFTVPGFTLTVLESGADKVALLFEEAGTNHRVECSPKKLPR